MSHKKLVIASYICGSSFAKKVIDILKNKSYPDLELLDMTEIKFANTEIKTIINKSIRDSDFFLIQDCETRDCGYSANDSIEAMKTALDAAFQSHVSRKTLIILSYPYARQDKANAREGVSASRLAQELEDVYQTNSVISMDIHNNAIAGFFRKALPISLTAMNTLTNYINESIPDCTKIIFADVGGSARAENFANVLKKDITGFQKKRDNLTGETDCKLLGKVKKDICVIVEDMIDTAGTIVKACEMLKKEGAKKVYCVATHGLFNGPAEERLSKAYEEGFLNGVICTDSVYHSDEFKKRNPWYVEVSVASYVAKVIHHLHNGESVSALLD